MPLTPSFLMNLESRMQRIVERDYIALSSNLWWDKVAIKRQSASKREVIYWLISTASLTEQGTDGGKVDYDEIEALSTEITNVQFGRGLRLSVNQLTDLDGNGIEAAASWSADMGKAFAYKPQELISDLMKTGTSAIGYDGKAMFATDHPINPLEVGNGSFANLFTGAVNGTYPGALPIDVSVTADVALANLGKLFAYMAGIKQPNGLYPRRLRPVSLLVPPALAARATLLTDAKFIATTAGSGAAQGGSTDVEGLIKLLGFGTPIVCDELGANFPNGSDTTYYVRFAPNGQPSSQLGPIVYQEREAYSILYHGPTDQAELDRKDLYEWKARGRNAVSPGHPWELVRVAGS